MPPGGGREVRSGTLQGAGRLRTVGRWRWRCGGWAWGAAGRRRAAGACLARDGSAQGRRQLRWQLRLPVSSCTAALSSASTCLRAVAVTSVQGCWFHARWEGDGVLGWRRASGSGGRLGRLQPCSRAACCCFTECGFEPLEEDPLGHGFAFDAA
mmetsp:Transcript_82191/g.249303  ORF Transcript_82191/g.249303 Transcript_82191/m.249303 type:complete len:154 (+) Transcript_82191:402-863(+)